MNKKNIIMLIGCVAALLVLSTSLSVSAQSLELELDKRLVIDAPDYAPDGMHWIKITVRNQGQPVGGAIVEAEWAYPGAGITNKQGEVWVMTPFYVPYPTTFYIRAMKASFVTDYHSITIL